MATSLIHETHPLRYRLSTGTRCLGTCTWPCCLLVLIKMWKKKESLLWLSNEQTRIGSMRMQVWPMASLKGLRIQSCHELRCRLQTPSRSHLAVAVMWASSYSSSSTPGLVTSVYHGYNPKKQTNKQTKRCGVKLEESHSILFFSSLLTESPLFPGPCLAYLPSFCLPSPFLSLSLSSFLYLCLSFTSS